MKLVNREKLWQSSRVLAQDSKTRGDLESAERTLVHALKDGEDYSELNSGIVDDLHDLAAMHCTRRNYHNAERIFRQVIESKEKILGQYHANTADSLEKRTDTLANVRIDIRY